MKSQKPLSRKENIVVQELEGEVLVYDLGNNKAFCLNETSAIVWEACDGNRSISEISDFVAKKTNSSASEELVWLALDQLKKEALINNPQDLEISFNGLSRREAIRKVGFASLVALPVIMAVTAPNAYAQASVCGPNVFNGCACVDSFCNTNVDFTKLGAVTPNQNSCSGTVVSGVSGVIANCASGGFSGCTCMGPFTCDGVAGAGFRFGQCS